MPDTSLQKLLNQAVDLLAQGNWQSALTKLDELVLRVPGAIDVWYLRGEACRRGQMYKEALSHLNQALGLILLENITSRKADILFVRGRCYRELKLLNESIADLLEATLLQPNDQQFRFHLALALLLAHRHQDVVPHAKEALALLPTEGREVDRSQAHELLGFALLSLRKFDEALAEYNKAIDLSPTEPLFWCQKGRLLIDTNRISEAIAALDEVVRLAATNPFQFIVDTHRLRSVAYLRNKNVEAAMACVLQGLELLPNCAELLYQLGLVYKEQQEHGLALANFDKALRIGFPSQPKSYVAEAHYQRGLAWGSDNLQEAIADFRAAIQLQPNFAAPYHSLGLALSKVGKHTEALDAFDSYLVIAGANGHVMVDKASALIHLNRLDEAIETATLALGLNPDKDLRVKAHLCRVSAYDRQGSFEEALADLNVVVDLRPDDAQIWYWRGTTHWRLGKFGAASSDLKESLRLKREAVTCRFLVSSLRSEGKLEEALETAHEALTIDPGVLNHLDCHHQMALIYLELNLKEESIASWTVCAELSPNEALYHVGWGHALCHANRFKEALAQFDIALELPSEDPQPRALRGKAYIGRGQCLVGLDQPWAAVDEFCKAIGQHPKYYEGHYELGRVLLDLEVIEQIEPAIHSLSSAIHLRPLFGPAYTERFRARLILAASEPDEALAAALEMLALQDEERAIELGDADGVAAVREALENDWSDGSDPWDEEEDDEEDDEEDQEDDDEEDER